MGSEQHSSATKTALGRTGNRNRYEIRACSDDASVWIEFADRRGGNCHEFTPEIAREIADLLKLAASTTEAWA